MKVGKHDLDFEPPDLAIMRVRGTATPQDAIATGNALIAFSPGGQVFMLSYIEEEHDDLMSSEARRLFIERMRQITLVAVAVVGGSFRAQVMSQLLDGALRILTRKPTRLKFFDTDESARLWLRTLGCQR